MHIEVRDDFTKLFCSRRKDKDVIFEKVVRIRGSGAGMIDKCEF